MLKLKISEFMINDVIKIHDNRIEILDISDDKWEVDIDSNIVRMSDEEFRKMLFQMNSEVFTHNCMQRIVCGQLGGVASRMALDDNQATTIDGNHKGAGMVKAQGIVSHIQYYYDEVEWIERWFQKRGLTSKGWENHENPDASINPDEINLGEDEDITITKDSTKIEFGGIKKEVDNTRDQKFEEI